MSELSVTERRREVRADDPVLRWVGAVEVEHGAGWSRGWRLPLSRIGLFPGEALRGRAAMQAGVRVVFGTDAGMVGGRLVVGPDVEDPLRVDLVVDGELVDSAPVGADGSFRFAGVVAGEKTVEVWLPQFGDVGLAAVEVDEAARVWAAPDEGRPRLVTYGSSITHCRSAASPARTWPALVARELGADLTCLGFGGQCHLDPMVARTIGDLPADVIVTCLGINVYGGGSFTERSFLPAVLGLLATIRDGHPTTPLIVMSPIVCPDREDTAGAGGMSLAFIRAQVAEAVRLLREHGDEDVRLLDGLDVFGPEQAHMLGDGLHPDADGYAHMATSITPTVRAALDTAEV
ncbi:lysophospholipase L1-like esterase [Haloactinopolyspora alba]|uniref:Lysophospholipase L1-like esterase n=1 Tax=Haloactinopolyspora alba TaxID=648780 RepID=A0A2P8EC40_9ACTN|nr:SGNH/GDSL hydrolase family protein [Haloactinopolyspora alba]PSL07033.1 lysophospholipase L1-like esterase [Haloactinopolyspora alba]